jgi:hypothetical protein
MIEESLESFVVQYKPYAVTADLLAKTEGSPLVECIIAKKVVHFMERTSPYLSTPGKHNVIINGIINALNPTEQKHKSFNSPSLSKVQATGLVLEHHGNNLVVDVGMTLVLSSFEGFSEIALGDWISFESLAPLHGFVLTKSAEQRNYRRPEEDI